MSEAFGKSVQQNENEVVNGAVPFFNKDSSQNAPVKHERIVKKARRMPKSSPRKSESSDSELPKAGSIPSKKPIPYSKNSKKSRNAKGKTLPKGTYILVKVYNLAN